MSARAGQSIVVHPGVEGAPKRVLLVGLGPAAEADAEIVRRAAARASSWATDHRATNAALWLPAVRGLAQNDAMGAAARVVAEERMDVRVYAEVFAAVVDRQRQAGS